MSCTYMYTVHAYVHCLWSVPEASLGWMPWQARPESLHSWRERGGGRGGGRGRGEGERE